MFKSSIYLIAVVKYSTMIHEFRSLHLIPVQYTVWNLPLGRSNLVYREVIIKLIAVQLNLHSSRDSVVRLEVSIMHSSKTAMFLDA